MRLRAITLLALLTPALHAAFPSPADLPPHKDLPDPLTFLDGRRVSSPTDWPARRDELLALIQHYEYGHLPPPPKSLTPALLTSHALRPNALPHKVYKLLIECAPPTPSSQLGTDNRELGTSASSAPHPPTSPSPHLSVSFTLDLLTPKGPGPFPVILRGDLGWHKTAPEITDLLISRGYALAEFNRTELAPDNANQITGLKLAYPDADFGCVAAWAWGYHRAIDFLVTLPEIDKTKIAVTGHSRGGKAALLAGATDTRIALTNPNASGCAGAGCFRDTPPKAETLKRITTAFPYWFTPRLAQFADREPHLPFDQHSLKACVAPRALLCTEGLGDLWANPTGTHRTNQAARPVFQLLGAPDHHLALHYRPGPHLHSLEDWTALLDYADQVFHNKKSARDWHAAPPADQR